MATPNYGYEKRQKELEAEQKKLESKKNVLAKEALEKMAKDGDVGKDEVARAEKALEDLTTKAVGHIDDMLKHKEAELLEV